MEKYSFSKIVPHKAFCPLLPSSQPLYVTSLWHSRSSERQTHGIGTRNHSIKNNKRGYLITDAEIGREIPLDGQVQQILLLVNDQPLLIGQV